MPVVFSLTFISSESWNLLMQRIMGLVVVNKLNSYFAVLSKAFHLLVLKLEFPGLEANLELAGCDEIAPFQFSFFIFNVISHCLFFPVLSVHIYKGLQLISSGTSATVTAARTMALLPAFFLSVDIILEKPHICCITDVNSIYHLLKKLYKHIIFSLYLSDQSSPWQLYSTGQML